MCVYIYITMISMYNCTYYLNKITMMHHKVNLNQRSPLLFVSSVMHIWMWLSDIKLTLLCSESPEGYFHVEFVERVPSRQCDSYSFRSGLMQEDILCWRLLDDPDDMMKYRDTIASSPEGQYHVFDQNPIHLGFFLSRIE